MSSYSKCNAPTQLVIHRDESMMYYVYIRKIDVKKYIGFAVAINGYYFNHITSLFSLFEKQIEQLAERGIIINYLKSGDLTATLSSLKDEEEEVMSYINYLQSEISSIKTLKKLPQADYSVSINSQKIFNENDNNNEIVTASYTYGFTIILKQENYDTLRSTSYRNTLKQLNKQNESLEKEIENLKDTNKQILRQKKQFKKVIFLFLIVLGCGVGIYSLYYNLNNTQYELNTANSTIQEKNTIITGKNERISNLKDSIIDLENSLQKVQREKSDLSDKLYDISSHYPFIVTECEVNADRFKFKYYCLEEKEITVTLKAVNSKNSQIVTNVHTLIYHKGEGEKNLNFGHRLDTSQYYYVILLYNNQIIAGKYW